MWLYLSPDTARLSQPLRIIHDHCTSTTLKEKVWCFCIWCQFYPRNTFGAPLFLKAPLMTGLEGTARLSEKPTVVGRSEIEDLMAPKFDPNEVKARKDSQRFPQCRYVTLRDPCMVYIYPHWPTDYNGFIVDFIHLWHIFTYIYH